MITEVDYKPDISETIEYLHNISEEKRWLMVRQGIDRSVDIISRGMPVLFFLAEDTQVGGKHAVQALYEPKEGVASLEIPEEPEQQGGRFPTILHAVEVVASVTILANQREKPFYPEIRFVDRLRGEIQELEMVLIPLILDPNKSNVIAFHPQVRRIDPETLARSYYEAIKADTELPKDLLRHTMLVQALDWDRPAAKGEVTLKVLPSKETQIYRLMNTGRIARWFSPVANQDIILSRI